MQTLVSIEDLDCALNTGGPLLLFKHSSRCPTSAAALSRFSRFIEEAGDTLPRVCLIDVVESRPVSDEATARLGVTHQSPQLILARGGTALWNASHDAITAQAIREALQTC